MVAHAKPGSALSATCSQCAGQERRQGRACEKRASSAARCRCGSCTSGVGSSLGRAALCSCANAAL